MNDLERIKEVILGSNRFLITSHENPDADAIGSMLSLGQALSKLDKLTVFYNKDGLPEFLKFLPGSEEIVSSLESISGDFDCTMIVDSTGPSRVGNDFEKFLDNGRCGTTIIVDHHTTNKQSVDLYLLDPNSSSTGMMIYFLIKSLNIDVNPDIATNLYTTIIGDTGSFRHSNTNPQTFRVAAELVEYGAKPSEISQALYESETPERLKLIGLILPTLEVTDNGRIASVVLKKEMYSESGTNKQDTDGIVNLPRSIKGIQVAVLFSELDKIDEDESIWKVSLRSKGEVDVSMIAERFCGGGHKKAAGCVMKGSLKDVKQKMYSILSKGII
ncbi:bifunctional oligoribonuclease/PAP phosphatase NrnA [Desulfobacterota bacterium AH_259_B03_O07]|nr:bifunctional oligoribonuclease/PAP phosphatase NrnA [Desulfobacterota bacterium AH_259_B03_O07]